MFTKPKDRRIAALLAFAGAIPLPGIHSGIAGLHKFYLGQPRWGVVYLLLCLTPIPMIASAIEGIWYLFQDAGEFDCNFNRTRTLTQPFATETGGINPVQTIADALRELETLRQEGLISEYEFEQKRRQLVDRIG
jgi:TM2 domain-containing membrane protein YozV